MFLSGGSGVLSTINGEPLPGDPAADEMGAVFIDHDSDGDLDLYVVAGSLEHAPGADAYRDRLYINQGPRGWRVEPQPWTDAGGPVVAADFDADGDVDLFIGGRATPGAWPTSPISRLLRNDDGRFTDVTDALAPGLKTPGMITAALWTDADNDGRLDLMLTRSWGSVMWWRNTGNGFEDRTLASGLGQHRGWFNSISAGDWDGDGDLDYAVGNAGLNSGYAASLMQPVVVWFGSFGAGGAPSAVVAAYTDGALRPTLTFGEFTAAHPAVLERYPTADAFAAVSIFELLGSRLDGALRLEVDTLASGMFINKKGRFTFKPFSKKAQSAPIKGTAFLDVHGDGDLDLLYAQHGGPGGVLSSTPYDPTGFMVLTQGIGIFTQGNATAATLVHLDDDRHPEIAIATHAGPVFGLSYARRTQMSNFPPPYRVRLKGKAGDPGGYGARVTVSYNFGRKSVAEVHAGSGYLGQSQVGEVFGLPAPYLELQGSGSRRRVESVSVRWADGHVTTVPGKPYGIVVAR